MRTHVNASVEIRVGNHRAKLRWQSTWPSWLTRYPGLPRVLRCRGAWQIWGGARQRAHWQPAPAFSHPRGRHGLSAGADDRRSARRPERTAPGSWPARRDPPGRPQTGFLEDQPACLESTHMIFQAGHFNDAHPPEQSCAGESGRFRVPQNNPPQRLRPGTGPAAAFIHMVIQVRLWGYPPCRQKGFSGQLQPANTQSKHNDIKQCIQMSGPPCALPKENGQA